MTPEEQRIAIAEACQWSHELMTHQTAMWVGPNGEVLGDGQFPPNYLNDLNAIQDAYQRVVITSSLKAIYWLHLRNITGYGMFSITHQNDERLGNATATQRAEALLRTIGKWKD